MVDFRLKRLTKADRYAAVKSTMSRAHCTTIAIAERCVGTEDASGHKQY